MTETRSYRIALVQMQMGADPEANFTSALRHIREAARMGANIVCLPELFRTQYFCQREDVRLFDFAEPVPGPSTEKLAEVARETGVAIVASLFERRAPGLYHNTAVTLGAEGQIAGVYRKMHIPDDPLYYEKYYFTPGDLGFQAVDTWFGRVGTLVCWDQWYPEGGAAHCIARCRSTGLSHGHRLARRSKPSLAQRNMTRGRPSNAPTRLPTAFTWQR